MKFTAIVMIAILFFMLNCSSAEKKGDVKKITNIENTKDIITEDIKPAAKLPETKLPLNISDLHYAAKNGNEASVTNIINEKKRMDLNIQDNDGMTPLHYAAEWGNRNVAASLLEKGADVNAGNIYGSTPLFYVKNIAIAELLIKKGANVNYKDKWGETPLFWAVESGNFNLVNLLLSKGGDVNIVNFEKDTPLHCAVHYGNGYAHITIVNTLIKYGAGINSRDVFGWSPLHEAAEKGRYDMLLLILNKGADVNGLTLMDNDKHKITAMSTPLHIAIKRYDDNMNIIQLLIGRGANLKMRDKNSMTPYELALYESKLPDEEWYGTASYKMKKRQGLVKIAELLKKSEPAR